MKLFLVLAMSTLVSISAFAQETVAVCDGGAAVIDHYHDIYNFNAPVFQLIIRDSNIVRYFNSGHIEGNKASSRGELIFDHLFQLNDGNLYLNALIGNNSNLNVTADRGPGQSSYQLTLSAYLLTSTSQVLGKADWIFRDCHNL